MQKSYPNSIRAYSIQGYDLRTFLDRIDIKKGTYRDQVPIRKAQELLYQKIGESQVIWCTLEAPSASKISDQHLHIIDIDFHDRIWVLDSFCWNHIIGNTRFIPTDIHRQLRCEALRRGDATSADMARIENDYIINNLPDDPWNELLPERYPMKDDQILVKFPFEFSRIVSVEPLNRPRNRKRGVQITLNELRD